MADVKSDIMAAVAKGVTAAVSSPATAASQADKPIITQAVVDAVAPIVANATNNEPWYQSRVTWGAILTFIAAILGIFGKADMLPADVQGKIIDGIVALGPLIGAAVVIYGRYAAKKPIGS